MAQEEEEDRPVRRPFESTMLVENQTIMSPWKGELQMIIHHRFGTVENGLSDLYGIYAPSNIRLGLQYGITDDLMIGFGTEKNNKIQELYGKYAVLKQTMSGKVPVSVSVLGNVSIDARNEDVFGEEYESMDRLSYFAQILIARKFNDNLSLLLAPSYSHFNAVDSTWQHDRIGLMAGGRMKITDTMSALFEYHQPFKINPLRDYHNDSEPGIALGIEIGTSTLAFQVFATNYGQIISQKNYVMNKNEFEEEGIMLGFNITVRL